MNSFLKRVSKLVFGLFLYAIGIVVTMNANIGYAPWEVFHGGIAKNVGLTIGVVSIYVGLIICIIAYFMGEKLGLGTIINMILIGVFMDIIIYFNIIPTANGFVSGFILLMIGLTITGFASYFYISAEFGAGPRDSLMVAIQRKTGLKVGICRILIEISVVIIGWALGGAVGVGTIISAFAIGVCVEFAFKTMKFDATKVTHETLDITIKKLTKTA